MEAAGLATLARPSLETLTDEDLCARVAGGDGAAFEALFLRHQRALLSFCRHMLRSLHEAEDVVQHTFLAAYGRLEQGDAPRHCRAWLYAIARNRCLTVIRDRPETLPQGREPETDGLDKQVERMSELRALLGALERLPSDQRSAIVLFELEALSQSEIADVLDVDQRKVKSLVFQARTTLSSFRAAGDIPCTEVRRRLSSLHGGALNARGLKHHLEICSGCTAFREEMRRQRAGLAVVIPVVPAVAWSKGVIAALPGAGAGAAAVAGGSGSAGSAAVASGGSAGAGASGLLAGVSSSGGALGTVAASVALGLATLVAVNAGGGDDKSPAATPPAAQAAAPPTPGLVAPRDLAAGGARTERARTRRQDKRRRAAPAAPAPRKERAAPAPVSEPVASAPLPGAPPPSSPPPSSAPVAPAPVSAPPRPQGAPVQPGVRFDDSGPVGPVNYPRAEPR
jgi:RNA polymerase sigma factor (sigma-70 family)